MKRVRFSADIASTPEKVWLILWDDATYRQWTAPFMPGSYAVSDWQEGSKVHFLAPGGSGMYSVIDRMVPFELMSFKHIGTIKDGVEQPISEQEKQWTGAQETYTLTTEGGKTHLLAEVDTFGSEWEDMLLEAFPKAMDVIKDLSEKT